nr:hypothetical protein [uncultured Blautia sp.]
MKNMIKGFLGAVFAVLFTVTVWADAGNTQGTDYPTDYYMIVESKEGGINIYAEPDLDSQKLNEQLIPNGTALHIEGEKKTDDKRVWGYTRYHGMYGFVPTDDLKPVTRSEAVKSEYYLYGGEDADYDLTVAAKDGSVALYHGPGEKYDTVSGADQIPNGQTLHITAEADAGEDGLWGKTDYEGIEGWVNIHQAKGEDSQGEDADGVEIVETVNPTENPVSAENTVDASQNNAAATDAEVSTGKVATDGGRKTEVTPTQKPTATPIRKPEATPTKKPEATATPKPEATPTQAVKEVTPTEEVITPTEKAVTPTEEVITPTEKAVTPTEEAITPTDKASTEEKDNDKADTDKEAQAKEASSQETKAKETGNLVLWILLAAVIIGVIIVVVLVKKNKKNS